MVLEGGKQVLIFQEGTMRALVLSVDKKKGKVPMATSTNIRSACIVPQTNLFTIATEESINFYNTADGSLNSDLTYSLSQGEPNRTLVQAIKMTSNGSRIALCFGSHLSIYNFGSDQGVDLSSKFFHYMTTKRL